MPRTTRVLAAAATVVATSTLLAACDRPTPQVTVLSGSRTTVVRPQSYCFDLQPSHCKTASKSIGVISAKAGSTLLIDVPREVATKDWAATSASQQSDGTLKELTGNGLASGALHDTHSTRIQVPFGVDTYYLVVLQLHQQVQTGSWVARIKVSG